MAKNRLVSTGFWSDHYVADLDPTEKLLFLYLLTCERSTLAGVYELPLKIMAVEAGIDVFMIEKILGRFEVDGKVKYQTGWVAVKNFLKHHEHGSPTVRKGIDEAIKAAPEWAREFVGKGIDTLSPSSLSSSLSPVRATPVTEEKDTQEDVVEKPKPKYPDAKKVLDLFGDYPKTWERNTTQLIAAQSLFEKQGVEGVKNALSWYEDLKDRDFCPQIDSPYDLESKWGKFDKFVEKHS